MKKYDEWLRAQKKEINYHQRDNYKPQENNEEYAYNKLVNYNFDFSKLDKKRILEIGSGTRGAVYYLNKKNMNIGIDPMPLQEFTNLEKWKKSFLVRGMGEYLGIKDESIDIIICHNVIDHAVSPEKLLEECYRILKHNGSIFFGTHVLRTKYKKFRYFISKADTTHPHHFTKNEFYKDIKKWFVIDNENIISGIGDNQGVVKNIINRKFKFAAGNLLLDWIQISCAKKSNKKKKNF